MKEEVREEEEGQEEEGEVQIMELDIDGNITGGGGQWAGLRRRMG